MEEEDGREEGGTRDRQIDRLINRVDRNRQTERQRRRKS